MKVLVPIKRVVDHNVRPRVRTDASGIETRDVRMSINAFDEIAMEEAVRLREAGVATEIVAVSVGVSAAQDVLRTALAAGADRATLIDTNGEDFQPLAVARHLKAICEREQPNVVLCGKQATDDDAGQVGPMLAALMGWPQVTFASRISLGERAAVVVREIDGGQETVETGLPAVITVDLRLNEPRYITLPNIMKAKKKPLEVVTAESLAVKPSARLTTVRYTEPCARAAGVKVKDVAELVGMLRKAGVVA